MHGCIEELTISQSPGYVRGRRVEEGWGRGNRTQDILRIWNSGKQALQGDRGVNANILEHKKDGRVSPHPHWQKGPFL